MYRAFMLLKVLVGLGAVGFLVFAVFRDNARHEANHRPAEDLRQAKDICRMWGAGFHAAAVPSLSPSKAEDLLNAVLSSAADEPVKQEAQALLDGMARLPNYYRLAAHATAFRTEADKYVATRMAAGPAVPDLASGRVTPGVLVVTLGKPTGTEADARPDVFFDAEMIEACGAAVPDSPERVRTLVTLEWDRAKIGEFEVTGFEVNGKTVPLGGRTTAEHRAAMNQPAYRHTCQLLVFSYPEGTVVGGKQFAVDDPPERRAGSGPSTEQKVRAEVRTFLGGLQSQ